MKKILLFLIICFSLSSMEKVQANTFLDVPKEAEFYEAVEWAVHKGLISGYKDGTFRPYNTLTEGQFVKMYVNLLPFEGDKTSVAHYENHYNLAYTYGVPVSKGHDFRHMPVWRGNVAQMLVYALGDAKYSNYDYVAQYLMDQRMSSGQNKNGQTPKEIFGYNKDLKRYHAVLFLYRMFGKSEQPYLGVSVTDNGYITLTKESDIPVVVRYEPNIIALGPETWHKRIALSNRYSYELKGDSYNNLEVAIYAGTRQVGGIMTTVNQILQGETIGQQAQRFTFSDEQYIYTVHRDKWNEDRVFAIEWIERAHQLYTTDSYKTTGNQRNIAYDRLVVELMNALKAQYDIQPVIWDANVSEVVFAHSVDLVEHDYFDHIGLDGSSPNDRIARARLHYIQVSEILTHTFPSPGDILTSFLTSKPHRAQVLSARDYVGLGTAFEVDDEIGLELVVHGMNFFSIEDHYVKQQ